MTDETQFHAATTGGVVCALLAQPMAVVAVGAGDLRWGVAGLATAVAAWVFMAVAIRAHRRNVRRMLGHLGRKEGSGE